MKRSIFKTLRLANQAIKTGLYGRMAETPKETAPKRRFVDAPKDRPKFNDWVLLFNVSSRVKKEIVISRVQIAERFNISVEELVVQ